MEKQLIGRGLLAGTIGGVVSFVFARIFAEPLIARAIEYQSARESAQRALDKAAGLAVSAPEADLFSRTVQGNLGIGVAMVFFGAALGALVAVAFAVCLGRTGSVRPRPLVLLIGAAGFVGLYLVPFVKYPANPPAVGREETIATRGALFLVMVFCSVVLLFLAVYFGQRLAQRVGTWQASLLSGAAYLVLIGVVMALLPSFGEIAANVATYGRYATETPRPLRDPQGTIVMPGFPADLLYSFRLYSVAAQLILWTTLALVFAPMAEKVVRPTLRRTSTPAVV